MGISLARSTPFGRSPPISWKMVSDTGPLYGTALQCPLVQAYWHRFEVPVLAALSWHLMIPCPDRPCSSSLVNLCFTRAFISARQRLPNITEPLHKAYNIARIPDSPSAMMGTSYSAAALAQSYGSKPRTPARMTRVVMEPPDTNLTHPPRFNGPVLPAVATLPP